MLFVGSLHQALDVPIAITPITAPAKNTHRKVKYKFSYLIDISAKIININIAIRTMNPAIGCNLTPNFLADAGLPYFLRFNPASPLSLPQFAIWGDYSRCQQQRNEQNPVPGEPPHITVWGDLLAANKHRQAIAPPQGAPFLKMVGLGHGLFFLELIVFVAEIKPPS